MALGMVSVGRRTASTQSPDNISLSADQLQFQEELELIRQENKQCWRHVQQLETTLARMRSAAQCSKDERELLKKKLRELQVRLTSIPSPLANTESETDRRIISESAVDQNDQEKKPPASPIQAVMLGENSVAECRPATPAITPKIAERVRLKRFPTDDVLGSEICSLGVTSVRLAEHLAETVQEASHIQELYRTLSISAKQHEFTIELENLRRRANRTKAQVSFLELTLVESRSLSDNLSSVCAQLESNETALQLALSLDDQIEQGSNCLLDLADARLAFVLASCQAVHSEKGQENNELLSLAKEELEKLESDAKGLLKRLEMETVVLVGGRENEEESGTRDDENWNRNDEIRMRSIIRILKMQRDSIRRSVVNVQPVSAILNTAERGDAKSTSLQEEKLSLENAVLVQELMAVKEEKTQLKGKAFVLEKENEILLLATQEKDVQIAALKKELEERRNVASQEASETDVNPQETETSSDYFGTLLAAQELRQQRSDHLVEYLKRINDSLLAKFQRSKRKHKSKLRRLQYALRYISEQYELELGALRGQLLSETARDSGNDSLFSNCSGI